jgi:hypothetical protein
VPQRYPSRCHQPPVLPLLLLQPPSCYQKRRRKSRLKILSAGLPPVPWLDVEVLGDQRRGTQREAVVAFPRHTGRVVIALPS